MLFLLAMLVLPADAGKLSEGFRGVPYGSDAVLSDSPLDGCTKVGADSVLWSCPTKIGGADVKVSYMADEGIFFGMFIEVSGYTNCSEVMTVLQQAYGKGIKENEWDKSALADRIWRDGKVVASFEYNKYTDKAKVAMFDSSLMDDVKKIKADRAKGAVDDL